MRKYIMVTTPAGTGSIWRGKIFAINGPEDAEKPTGHTLIGTFQEGEHIAFPGVIAEYCERPAGPIWRQK